MASPAADVAGLINSQSIATSGTDLFVGRTPTSPYKCVVVMDSGGAAPNPKWARDDPDIQIIVRGDRNNYSDAYDLALSIKNYLLGLELQTVGTKIYARFIMRSDITFIHYDENNCPVFTMNWRLTVDLPDTGNRLTIS